MESTPCSGAPTDLRGSLRDTPGDVLKIKHVKFVFLLYFLIFLGFNFFYTAFPVHAARSLDWSIPGIGAFFGVLSLMMVVVQGPVLKGVSKLASEAVLIIAGSPHRHPIRPEVQ